MKPWARRIPAESLSNQPVIEAIVRCEEAARLEAKADMTEDVSTARFQRRKADKLLNACSMSALNLARKALDGDLRQARLDGSDGRVRAITIQIEELGRNNPQPDPEKMAAAVGVEVNRLKMPPASGKSVFTRRFGKKRVRSSR